MSAAENLERQVEDFDNHDDLHSGRLSVTPEVVEVRRRASLSAAVGGVASVVGVLYLQRATDTGAVLDWSLTVVMALVAAYWLRSFIDARVPLLVADAQGVRLRLGRTWSGLRWSAVHHVEHDPHRAWWRDGRLVIVPRNTEKVLSELDPAALRQARLAERLWGAPFALPLGISTRVVGAEGDLTAALAQFSEHSDVAVVEFDGAAETLDRVEDLNEAVETVADRSDEAEPTTDHGSPNENEETSRAGRWSSKVQSLLERRTERSVDVDVDVDLADDSTHDSTQDQALLDTQAHEPVVEGPEPTRPVQRPRRFDLVADEKKAADAPPQGRELRVPGRVTLVEETVARGVTPIATVGDPVEPLVLDDHAAEPAEDPVIGPELAAARTRLGLTVDALAERTRIRPHVIEAIEVDDFEPCGGDFYAKGHLRTLARVLGLAPEPLVESYEERYSHAPINPRRVFEADLASAGNGALRTSRSGPNWSALVAVVMAVILAWSIARLVMDGPEELRQPPGLDKSSAVSTAKVPVTISTGQEGAKVVVRDGLGKVVFRGNLAAGASKKIGLVAGPHITVTANSDTVRPVINGKKMPPIGEAGQRPYKVN